MSSVRDNIPTLRARDMEAVAEMVFYLYTKGQSGELDGAAKAQKVIAAGYAGVMKAKKSANLDAATVWAGMVSTLHGFSPAKAAALCAAYPTPRSMFNFVSNRDEKTARKEIAGIKVKDRNLGPKLAEKVYNVFK